MNSIVRDNLMNDKSYRPYCGNNEPRNTPNGCDNPRAYWDNFLSQFVCPKCGWMSDFPIGFIAQYKKKHNIK